MKLRTDSRAEPKIEILIKGVQGKKYMGSKHITVREATVQEVFIVVLSALKGHIREQKDKPVSEINYHPDEGSI